MRVSTSIQRCNQLCVSSDIEGVIALERRRAERAEAEGR